MHVKNPWYEVDLGAERPFNMVIITEAKKGIRQYRIQSFSHEKWEAIFEGSNTRTVKIHRFDRVWGSKIRILFDNYSANPTIAELGVYDERR